MTLVIRGAGAELRATLSLPANPRGGVVVLHGSNAGDRSYFLYEHVAACLHAEGIAVLRYDRRPSDDGEDVPFGVQAADALAAIDLLHDRLHGPVGIWAYSQGVWAAALAASTSPSSVEFLVAVSGAGVSPALQMRTGSAKQLRKHGIPDEGVTEMLALRLNVEQYLRTGDNRDLVQAELDRARARPWFPYSYLQPTLSAPGSWKDMDFDPQPVFDKVSCPVLAFFGETDEWIPIEESVAAWSIAHERGAVPDLTVVRLPGADHLPTIGGTGDPEAVSDLYSNTVADWVSAVVARR